MIIHLPASLVALASLTRMGKWKKLQYKQCVKAFEIANSVTRAFHYILPPLSKSVSETGTSYSPIYLMKSPNPKPALMSGTAKGADDSVCLTKANS